MGRNTACAAVLASVAFATLAACHLADSPDPITCAAGTHADTGRCVQDDVAANVITIGDDDAGACLVTPDTIIVASTGQFQFKNDDNVEHTILGIDGQSWATVAAHQLSPFIGITKPGHWDYEVSGCAKGGTVTIE
ncbi:MAG: hypothetical protein JWO86_6126 [Myxococcaceae bacterium]|jgi:hypothetical protein|nr:hypothetical protein [Myxococcaceae bacterium]MEA2747163.1 hypothetical protein [Myxococcales bacterium]